MRDVIIPTFTQFLEDYADMGKLSSEELTKGQPISKDDFKDDFKLVSGNVFHKAINGIKKNAFDEHPIHNLSEYTREDYNKMECYLGSNNSSGYCIDDSEIVSLFSTQGSSGHALVKSAIENGGNRLDCFAKRDDEGRVFGMLYGLYSKHGFKIDTEKNSDEPYKIVNGISEVVGGEKGDIVIYMKL